MLQVAGLRSKAPLRTGVMDIVKNVDGNEEDEAGGEGVDVSTSSKTVQLTPLTTITPINHDGTQQPTASRSNMTKENAKTMPSVNSVGKENVLSYVEIQDEPPQPECCDHGGNVDNNCGSNKENDQAGSNERPLDLNHGLLFDEPLAPQGINLNIPDDSVEPNQLLDMGFAPNILGQIQNVMSNLDQHINANDGNGEGNPGQNTGMIFSD